MAGDSETFGVHVEGDVAYSQIANGHHIVQIGDVQAGAIVNVSVVDAPPRVARRTPPILIQPPLTRPLVDRRDETAAVLSASGAETPVEFHAEGGFGKSALLRQLAHAADLGAWPNGIVFVRAARWPMSDLLQELFDAFYERSTDWKPTDMEIRHALTDIAALIVLDDVELDRDELDDFLGAVPKSAFIVSSRDRHLWSGGLSLALRGLSVEDGVELFEQELGRRLEGDERVAVRDLCIALDGHPLRILEAAAAFREKRKPLAALLALAGEPADALTGDLIGSLSEAEVLIAESLAVPGGAPVPVTALAADDRDALEPALDALQSLHLAEPATENRWQLTDAARLRISRRDLTRSGEALSLRLAEWAEGAPDARDVAAEAPAILGTLAWAANARRWDDAKRLSCAVESAFAAAARWGAWEIALENLLRAGKELGDLDAQAYALHQLGTRALLLGDHPAAGERLGEAAKLRQELGDERGAAASEHNLGLVLEPPPPAWVRLWTAVGMKGAALLLALVVAGAAAGGVLLRRHATPAKPTVTPDRIIFGAVPVGSPSTPKSVTLHAGSKPLSAIDATTDNPDYAATDDCPPTLAAGSDCTITVTYTPTAAGDSSAKLTIKTGGSTLATIPLTGTPTSKPSVTPATLDFGEVTVAVSLPKSVTLHAGSKPLSAIDATTDNPAYAATDDCPPTLAAGSDCTITVTYTPTAAGDSSAKLTIKTGGSTLATIPLTGTGRASATITIAPDATNEVGAAHTFTVTLMKDSGTGTFAAAAGEHVTVVLTDSNGAVHTAPKGSCATEGANTNASGQCTIEFVSRAAGKVTGHASSMLSVNGSAPFTVSTDGIAPNSADAVKTFVDANIGISPLKASNKVGTLHVLTGHVNVSDGTGFVNAPAGTMITFAIAHGRGSFVDGIHSCATDATGSCSVTITSTTVAATLVSAASSLSVGGVRLKRTTDGVGANSERATKSWTR